MKVVVGISGKAHSGKSTVSEMLVQKYGFERLAFGDTLKWLVNRYFDIPVHELWVDKKKPEVRKLLQSVGDLMRCEVEEQYFVRVIEMALKDHEGFVAIEDVRYSNEVDMLKNNGGILIKIDREDGPKVEYGADHSSETDLDDFEEWDYIIKNFGTVGDLHNKVDTVVRDIMRSVN